MEKFPKTYIGRYPTAASLTAGRTRVMSLARAVSTPTNNWAFVEETNTIWAQNKNGEWIDTGKAFIRTDTFKGNPLIADGTINWEMQGLKVFGKSKQASTTGAQLISKNDIYGKVTVNGIAKTPKDISIWEFLGSATSDTILGAFDSEDNMVLGAGQYVLSVYGTSKIKVAINKFSGGCTAYISAGENVKITLEKDEPINIVFKALAGIDVTGTLYVMINAGSTALPWEPYTGGMPSPNPEYPQEIVSTGDDGQVDLTVTGKNICNQSGDELTVSTNIAPIKAYTGKITIGVKKDSGTVQINVKFWFADGQKGKDKILVRPADKNGYFVQNVFDVENIIGFSLYYVNSEPCTGLNVVAVLGETSINKYIPYQPPQLLPIPTLNGLTGIPVDSGGNYTDETGQQWICDYVDFARGVKVQNCFSLTIYDFSRSGVYQPPANGYTNGNFRLPYPASTNYTMHSLCDKFKYSDSGLTIKFNMSNLFIYFMIKGELNVNQWKEKMTELSPTVIYPLETPIETPLSSEELTAYQGLTSYDGATNIFSDEEVGLEAELVTDKIDKDGYADPSAELSLYYAALAGFVSLSDVPMPSCRESELVRKLIDPEFELSFEVNDSSSRKEKYLWDLINGTTEMLSNNPLSNTEKFLHIMLGGEVSEYPVVHSELEYWMDVCATFYGKI